jgi:hypothetical protein
MIAHLISSVSALPTDSSALVSAISALESSVEALERSSEGLEPWIPRFTWLVVLGVALEIGVVIIDHKEAMNDWRRTLLHPEKPSSVKLWFEIASVILVTVGIVGELVVGIGISSINGELRAQSRLLRSKSDQLLALVTREAGDAKDSATAAKDAASSTKTEADAAKSAAAKALELAQAADRSLADFQARLAWRTVSDKQKKGLYDWLRAFRGRSVDVSWDAIEPEQNSFAPQLINALIYAGLFVNPTPAGMNVLSPDKTAVFDLLLEGNDKAFEEALVKAFVCTSLATSEVPRFPGLGRQGNVNIRIRPKNTMAVINKKDLASHCQ